MLELGLGIRFGLFSLWNKVFNKFLGLGFIGGSVFYIIVCVCV